MADVIFAAFLLVGFWCISLVIDYIMIPFYVLAITNYYLSSF